jgi:ABC-2 type transport system ATP-binding protein
MDGLTRSGVPADVTPPLVDGTSPLAAAGVSKRYGHKLVLDDASLSERCGEAVAVIGENGAGKSTLLGICAGLIRPDRGQVVVRGRLGYCPQEPGLFDLLSADEHLARPPIPPKRQRAVDAVQAPTTAPVAGGNAIRPLN